MVEEMKKEDDSGGFTIEGSQGDNQAPEKEQKRGLTHKAVGVCQDNDEK